MGQKREAASSIIINDKLWVTGGGDGTNSYQKSTEYITVNEEVTEAIMNPGPDLPIAMVYHVIIANNQSCAMVIGGTTTDNDYSRKTWYYDWESENWIKGPELATGRNKHIAGQVVDQITHEVHIIVAGGHSSGNSALDSTEILFSGKTQWVEGIIFFL